MGEWTLTGLRVVVEVSRTGSFSAAADALGYTQSAVSRQVAACEAVAGTSLFERRARGVRPTLAGEALVRHAGRVLEGVAAASQELAGLRDRLAGRLAVGAFPTANAVLVPRAIAAVVAAHPGLQVELTEAPTPAQLAALRRGRLEVAVIATGAGLPDYDLDGLRLTEVHHDLGVGVAVAAEHPWAGRAWVEAAELADQSWVVGGDSAQAPQFGAWPGLDDPRIAFTARDWTTRLGLVAAGLGITLVPGLATDALPPSLRWVPVRPTSPGLGRTMWIATETGPGTAARIMVEAIERQAGRLGDARHGAVGPGEPVRAPRPRPRSSDTT